MVLHNLGVAFTEEGRATSFFYRFGLGVGGSHVLGLLAASEKVGSLERP